MKNLFKFFGFIAFAAIIGFTMTGCDQEPGRLPLDTPQNVRVDNETNVTQLTLRWDAVTNADGYTLDIDGILIELAASRTWYDLRSLTENPRVYEVSVRAKASSTDQAFGNSNWSNTIDVEPALYMFETDDDTAANIQIARSAGSGLSINGLTPFGKTLERVVIPSQIGSRTITAIGDSAFNDSGVQMTSVSLPPTIITIGANAFEGTNITNIVIPDSVLEIGNGAFSGTLLVIVIFVAIEPPQMGTGVFTGSNNIESIVISENANEAAFNTTMTEQAPTLADKITTVTTTGIAVTTPPTKTTYFAGDTLNPSGIVVTATLSDSTTVPVNPLWLSFRPTVLNTVGSAIPITVEYIGLTATFNVTVNAAPTGLDQAVNGTWVRTVTYSDDDGYSDSYEEELTLNNGAFTLGEDGQPYARGTYTAWNGSMTYVTTHRLLGGEDIVEAPPEPNNPNNPGGAAGNPNGNNIIARNAAGAEELWFTKDEARVLATELGLGSPAEIEEYLNELFLQGTGTYNIANNTLTLVANGENLQYTKRGTGTQSYNINVHAGSNGSVSTNPQGSAAAGTTVTINVNPAAGYVLNTLVVMNASTNATINHTSTLTFTMPAAPVTIMATFTQSTGGVDPAVNGDWTGILYEEDPSFGVSYEYEIGLNLNNGAFLWYQDDFPFLKGTYTASNGNMTYTVTHVNLLAWAEGGSGENPGSGNNEGNPNGNIAIGRNAAGSNDNTEWLTRNEAKNLLMASGEYTEEQAEEMLDMYYESGITGTYNLNQNTLTLNYGSQTISFSRN